MGQQPHDDQRHKAGHADIAGKQAAELEDHQADRIRKAALIGHGEPGPFRVVHFPLDGANGREARCAQQLEHQ